MMDKVIPLKVAVRARPLIGKEEDEGCQVCLNFIPNEPQLVLGKDRAFTYDHVFSPGHQQEVVYNSAAKPLIKHIFKGYNATILAYGQTGSGKTFTMGGCYEASLKGDREFMGIIPRVLLDLFEGIEERESTEIAVKVSYLEIYNEDINDLMCPPHKREPLAIREDTDGGIKIPGLREVTVKSFTETMKCLELGSEGRTTGATAMNATSSRSHAIFTVMLEMKKRDDANDLCKAKFQLVDLAGSERVKRTHAEGDRFKEGVNINKGLLCLGNVISALGDETQKRSHIPYRDSKLTRILQDSLGGNSHTLMIACVSPADTNMEETLNTLRYADRARKIKNKPIVNRDPQAAEIMRLKDLVQQLQMQLIQNGGVITATLGSPALSSSSSEDVSSLMDKYKLLEEENEKLTSELQEAVDQSTNMCEKAIRLEMKCDTLRGRLKDLQSQVGLDFDMLSSSIDVESNPKMMEQMEKLKKLAEMMSQPTEEEKLELSPIEEETSMEGEDIQTEGGSPPDTPDTRAMSKEYALRQAKMSRELQELNKLLEKKEELASQMSLNDNKMESIKQQYQQSTKDLENEVTTLQKERDELHQALQSAMANTAASKVSEQRRKRLQELEQQINQLKKRLNEQCKMLKVKDQSDKQVTKLNGEIQGLKQQRVKLMKQMKEDSDVFRKWKQKKDKEVLQLQQKDRKRQCEIQKLQRENQKTQNVLKRKSEEAAAANKRLKEALAKQKQVLAERNTKFEKYDSTSIGNRVRSWLNHELEVRISIREAKYHLTSLLNDRKVLAEQLKDLRSKLDEGEPLTKKMAWEDESGEKGETSLEEEEIRNQIKSLEQERDLRNAQIADLQQKVVDADQEMKGKNTWESVHTMVEAKCAMKWLLEQAVTARADQSVSKSELKDSEESGKEYSKIMEKLEKEKGQLQKKYEAKITAMQKEHENKVLFLLSQMKSSSNNESLDDDTRKRLRLQEEEIERLNQLNDELQRKTEEVESMKKNMTKYMYQGKRMALMPNIEEPCASPFLSPTSKPKPKAKEIKKSEKEDLNLTFEEYLEDWDSSELDSESEWDGYNDDSGDSDWHATPLHRKKKSRIFSKAEKSAASTSLDKDLSKNTSTDQVVKCGCKGQCETKRCNCRKNNGLCQDVCGCSLSKCKNRETQLPQSTTPDSELENTEGSTMLNSTFVLDNDDNDTPTTSKPPVVKAGKKTGKVLGLLQLDNSADEFVKPLPPKGSDSNSTLTNTSQQDKSVLEGGLKKKRKLHSTSSSSSFFSPVL